MFKYLLAFSTLFLTLGSLGDLLSNPPIFLEILLSFKPLYIFLCLIFFILSALSKRYFYSIIFFLLLIINFYQVQSWYSLNPALKNQRRTSEQKIKLAIINVLYGNTDYQKTLDLVRKEKPDILLFIELEKAWFQEINKLSDLLPYSAPNDPSSLFEVKLKSNFPIKEFKIFPLDDPIRLTMTAILEINHKRVLLLIPHLPTPTDPARFSLRNKQLNNLAEILHNQNLPTILIGDFNTSIWSPYYRELINRTNLQNSRQGFGTLSTWYAFSTKLPLLAAPIDQILFSKDFKVVNSYLGEDIGSDHLPLISELQFKDNFSIN